MRKFKRAFALSLMLVMVCASMTIANAAELNGGAGNWNTAASKAAVAAQPYAVSSPIAYQGNYNYTKPNVNVSGWDSTNPGSWNPYNTEEKKIEISQGDFSLNYDISYSEDGSIRYVTQKVTTGDYDYQLELSMTNLSDMIENKNFEVNGQLNFGYLPAGIWKDFEIFWKQP